MLGGLRHINNKDQVNIYYDGEFKDVNGKNYHIESLNLIRHKYNFVKPDISADIIRLPGEPLIKPDHVHPDTYIFLRNLFLSSIEKPLYAGRKYYLTRNNCGVLNPASKGINIRSILNEHEVYDDLEKYGFEILQFENFTFEEKINIFNTASVIISPNSGGLTCSLFANDKTTIVEILPPVIQHHDHYKNICNTLNIKYIRFTNVSTVGESPGLGRVWNMIIDKSYFVDFIKTL
jgi:capsular polysaccharide biosynthesis protein